MDDELAAQAQEEAVAEFHKYLTFAIADGQLTRGRREKSSAFRPRTSTHGRADARLHRCRIARQRRAPDVRQRTSPAPVVRPPRAPRVRRQSLPPEEEFMRMLRLSNLDSEGMSDDTRDAFVNMAENLGLDPGDGGGHCRPISGRSRPGRDECGAAPVAASAAVGGGGPARTARTRTRGGVRARRGGGDRSVRRSSFLDRSVLPDFSQFCGRNR